MLHTWSLETDGNGATVTTLLFDYRKAFDLIDHSILVTSYVNTPHLWKFVDDTTASEVVPKGNTSNAQSIVNQVIEWSRANRVQLNPDKCKELRIQLNLIHLLLTEKK